MKLAEMRNVLANELRAIPSIRAVYEFPTLELGREWPAVVIRPLDLRVDGTARGVARSTVRWELWMGIPVDQKTSDNAWRMVQDTVDQILERFAVRRSLRPGMAVAEVESAGFAFVQRDVGPVIEARVVVTIEAALAQE